MSRRLQSSVTRRHRRKASRGEPAACLAICRFSQAGRRALGRTDAALGHSYRLRLESPASPPPTPTIRRPPTSRGKPDPGPGGGQPRADRRRVGGHSVGGGGWWFNAAGRVVFPGYAFAGHAADSAGRRVGDGRRMGYTGPEARASSFLDRFGLRGQIPPQRRAPGLRPSDGRRGRGMQWRQLASRGAAGQRRAERPHDLGCGGG